MPSWRTWLGGFAVKFINAILTGLLHACTRFSLTTIDYDRSHLVVVDVNLSSFPSKGVVAEEDRMWGKGG